MMHWLIEYIKSEGNCTAAQAEDVAYAIVDAVDELIHNQLGEEFGDDGEDD